MENNRIHSLKHYLFLSLMIIILSCTNVSYALDTATGFEGGDGSAENPYQISSIDQLELIRNDPDANYELLNDLDFDTGTWTPISQFRGTLDGKGHSISNITFDVDADYGTGIGFVSSNSGEIKNLGFIKFNISIPYQMGGGIVCVNNNGTIDNCFVSGNIVTNAAGYNLAGIAGLNNGIISNCVNCASLTITGAYGYLAGIANGLDGQIINSANYGKINAFHQQDQPGSYLSGIGPVNDIRNSVAICEFRSDPEQAYASSFGENRNVFSNGTSLQKCYFSSPSITELENSGVKFLSCEEISDSSKYEGLDFNNYWKMDESGVPYPALNTFCKEKIGDLSLMMKSVSDVSAQPNSYKSIKVTWKKLQGCSSYIIYCYDNSGSTNSSEQDVLAVVDESTTSYIHTVEANSSKKYFYSVVPVFDTGEIEIEGLMSPWSSSYVVNTGESIDTPEDTIAPVLERLKLSTPEVYAPGQMILDIDAKDSGGAGIRSITLTLKNKDDTVIVSKSYNDVSEISGQQSFSIQTGSAIGDYELYKVNVTDAAGNSLDYNGRFFESGKISVKNEFDIEFTGNLSNTNVTRELKNMEEGKTVVLKIDTASGGILQEDVLDAIKGEDKTLVVYASADASMQWVFYGKDITDETKDLDLNVSMEIVDGSTYGASGKVIKLTFADNGELPGKVNFRIKTDYISSIHDFSDDLYIYYENNSSLSLEENACSVIADGSKYWVYADLTHNSTFLISGTKLADPVVDPENSSVDPGKSSSDPENPSVDPGKSSSDPENPSLDPGKSSSDPKNPSVDPGKSSSDPGNPSVDPGKSSSDPENPSVTPEQTVEKTKVGTVVTVKGSKYKITSTKNKYVAFTKAKNTKNIVVPATIKIKGKTYKVTAINAKAFRAKKIRNVTIGKNVKKIKLKAFYGSKATTLTIKTKLLRKAGVKGALKGSKIKTVKVKITQKASKTNKTYVKRYKKYFIKSNAGRKVTVK